MRSSLVFSIEQNLCRAVSEAEWKLPKHVRASTCVCRTFVPKCSSRSRRLRRGHSDSYDFGLELEIVPAVAQVEVSTYLIPKIVTGEGDIGFHCERDNLNRTTTSVHDTTIVNSSGGIMLTNKLPNVQVIDKNKLRWFGIVMRREEESMLRVAMQLKMKGKRPRGNTTWLDNIDRHQKGKNKSLKEVLQTKCFKNRHD